MQTLIKCLSGDTIIFGISPELVVGLEVVLAYFWDDVDIEPSIKHLKSLMPFSLEFK
jgi:hypothetical protein